MRLAFVSLSILAILAAGGLLATGGAWGEEPKVASAKMRFVRSTDPATPVDLFMYLETEMAANSPEIVEVTGCLVGKVRLARSKMKDTNETCPLDPRIPGPWPVIVGIIDKVQADQVAITYQTQGPLGTKTLIVPKDFLGNTEEARSGTSVLFFAAKPRFDMNSEQVIGDFKAFESIVKDNPSNALKQPKFKVQLQR
jgi:hypothetical protein